MKRSRHPSPSSSPAYNRTLDYLYGLQLRGMKFGLRNIRSLARAAGHPERAFPSFHVAGTNGKGSTASFLAAILSAAGYRTGLYTSPHLVRFTERIRIDGVCMPEARLVEYADRFRKAIDGVHATFFEATTCIAFRYFADEQVDAAVIETGLGGRLDATNILKPLVSIITNVDVDHQEYLGTTIRRIAREKAGIIKEGAPVVTGAEGDALDVIRAAARRKGSRVVAAPGLLRPGRSVAGRTGGLAGVRSRQWHARLSFLGLDGEHQVKNAALALAALEIVRVKGLFPCVDARAVSRGLQQVRRLTGLRGRLERLRLPWADVTLDVAHNPHAVRTLVASLRPDLRRFDAVIVGILKDKDAPGMLAYLRECAPVIIAVQAVTERARPAEELVRIGAEAGLGMVLGGGVEEGIRKARRLARAATGARRPRILVTGSHYVVGEAVSLLDKNTLTVFAK